MTVAVPWPLDDSQRRAALSRAIQWEIGHGGRLESQFEYQAVVVWGQPVDHVLHLLLTLVTCGMWALVWLGLILFRGEKRALLAVDEFGNVAARKV